MKRVGLIAGILIIAAAAGWWVADYLALIPGKGVEEISLNQPSILPATSASPLPLDQSPVAISVEPFVAGFRVPWSIVFTSPERMLVTERPGQVRAVINGQLQDQPVASFPEVYSQSEDGLMGMTLDPNYADNNYIYLSMTYQVDGGEAAKVIRVTDDGTQLTDPQVIIDGIPAARVHAGNRLKFGPDGKLYVTTGDAANGELAQDMNSLAGKILRLNADGSVPDDNPMPGSPIYSLGHRNPQGIDWHPVTGNLYETEHGPSGFDGPGGGDEVNWIQAGKNYGWPVVSHDQSQAGMVSPLVTYTPAIAPAAGLFYRSTALPQLTNTFLFAGLKGEGIYQAVFDPDDPTKVVRQGKLKEVAVGRVREIIEGPDGYIYFSTSNQDGRGTPRPGDDTIYRLVPSSP